MPTHLSSDPTRLRQILINLIGNAVKFTDVGGVKIRVSSTADDEGLFRVVIEVKDTGRGLSAEQKRRLFQPFVQADNTTTREFGGTGLGLALSRKLSEALGGTIELGDCEPNLGCNFIFKFVASKAKRVQAKELRVSSAKQIHLDRVRVLLVDDSPDNRFLVKRVLNQKGAFVETAVNGRDAIEKALGGEYDVVLMDIQMPVVDGYEAARVLKAEGYKVPIVALTAHAMVEDRAKTHEAGFVDHLTKPLNAMELVQTVARITSAPS